MSDIEFCIAAIMKKYDFVKQLLLSKSNNIDPSIESNLVFRLAVRDSEYDIIALLLKDSRVDPCSDDHYALRESIRRNDNKLFSILYKDKRILQSITVDLFYMTIYFQRYHMSFIMMNHQNLGLHHKEITMNLIQKSNEEIQIHHSYPNELLEIINFFITNQTSEFELVDEDHLK